MPPAPTRRARREAEKKKSGARWAAAGAIAFLAVGGGGLFLVTQTNGDTSQVPSSWRIQAVSATSPVRWDSH